MSIMPPDPQSKLDPPDLYESALAERCYRPGCDGWVTGASDYCSVACESYCPDCFTPSSEHWDACSYYLARSGGI